MLVSKLVSVCTDVAAKLYTCVLIGVFMGVN